MTACRLNRRSRSALLCAAMAVAILPATAPTLAQDVATPTDAAPANAEVKAQKDKEELRGLTLDNDKKAQDNAAAKRKALVDAFPASQTTGKVEGKEGAGKLEAGALAAASINAIADDIAADVRRAAAATGAPEKRWLSCDVLGSLISSGAQSSGAAPVLLLAGEGTVSFARWEQFQFRACAIGKAFADLGVGKKPARVSDVGGGPGVGAVASIAVKLLQLVTPDWELGPVAVSASDRALVAAVADAYIGSRAASAPPIYWASQVSKLGGADPVFARLNALDKLDAEAAKALELKQALIEAAKKKLAAAKTASDKQVAEKALADRESEAAPLVAARTAYERLVKDLAGKEGETLIPINRVIDEAAAALLLGGNGIVLNLSIESSGGGYYSQKAIWHVLGIGGAPFWVSGGVVASYVAVRASDQRVLASGLFNCSAGYVRVSKAAQLTNRRGPAVPCGATSPLG